MADAYLPHLTTKSKGPLGSYYAVSDYKGVNPEYGTLEDLKALVDQAHALGMYVIFDWDLGTQVGIMFGLSNTQNII